MIEEKYIELLLKRCLNLIEVRPLFIHYNTLNKDFVIKVVSYAKQMGIKDIYLDEHDLFKEHDILREININDIKTKEEFNCNIWDEYAKKDAAFLILETEIPNLMSDIDSKKLAILAKNRSNTKPIYKEKQLKSIIPWCIAGVPNIYWAKEVLPNSSDPLKDFWDILSKICMLDNENPINSWNEFLEEQKNIVEKLNSLKIKKLYYKNSMGTDLEIVLPDNALWQSASSGKWIQNMPSYEYFTTPDYHKTNGIVYCSKPLCYNGKIIKDFYIKFKDGKAIEYFAKENEDVLKEIINSDNLSSYLGEAALVNYNSPISSTNMIFKTTLFDENAACHIALGAAFLECLKDSEQYSEEELDTIGINSSKNHVDFMIGTKDLRIEADTVNGKILLMKDGNLII